MPAERTPTVLIVEDEPDIRLMVRSIMYAEFGEVDVVGEVTDGIEALAVYGELDTMP